MKMKEFIIKVIVGVIVGTTTLAVLVGLASFFVKHIRLKSEVNNVRQIENTSKIPKLPPMKPAALATEAEMKKLDEDAEKRLEAIKEKYKKLEEASK